VVSDGELRESRICDQPYAGCPFAVGSGRSPTIGGSTTQNRPPQRFGAFYSALTSTFVTTTITYLSFRPTQTPDRRLLWAV